MEDDDNIASGIPNSGANDFMQLYRGCSWPIWGYPVPVGLNKLERHWYLFAVYGSPQRINRKSVWDNIRDLSSEINHPWCLLGDFNVILHNHERLGGISNYSRGACNEFLACVFDFGLLDLGYIRCPFT
ncbi:hypothetical protein Ahy_B05g078682 [Arachis hypogaea]|uniref:Endonuclease/exonuclease/phosphatase domain-containing protein n=1 Tax=Arachis hypogaea TaxID=3818 RepID=A0A444Z7T4_ARAHY|nr:hypothetical protein Ahy_B05g078682 [Arachis hypogaea]